MKNLKIIFKIIVNLKLMYIDYSNPEKKSYANIHCFQAHDVLKVYSTSTYILLQATLRSFSFQIYQIFSWLII